MSAGNGNTMLLLLFVSTILNLSCFCTRDISVEAQFRPAAIPPNAKSGGGAVNINNNKGWSGGGAGAGFGGGAAGSGSGAGAGFGGGAAGSGSGAGAGFGGGAAGSGSGAGAGFGSGAAGSGGGGNTVVVMPNIAAGLSPNFYAASCPQVNQIIQNFLTPIILADPGQAAGILRIFFHDCFVQGCDASILLLTPITELIATPNNQSIRLSSVAVLDNVKAAIEQACPGVVSCADTIALSTAVAVRLVGGPAIPMATGRRDSQIAATNQTVVNNIPPPTLSITALKQNFQNHGLNSVDLVALSGGHSIGRAHCRFVDLQLSPVVSPDLNPAFAANLSRICLPANSPAKQRLTVHLDFITINLFDNAYFQNVLNKRAVFHTDAELLNATDTRQLVQLYAQNQPLFFQQFTASMLKMSQLGLLTGNQGVIRRRCSAPN